MYYQCNHKNNQNKHAILLNTLFELWFSCTFSEILKKDKWLRKLRIIVQKQPSRGVLRKNVPKISSEFTEEHPCRSVISLKLQSKTNNIFHSISRKEFVTQQLLKAVTQNFAEKVLHHGLFLWIYSVFTKILLTAAFGNILNHVEKGYGNGDHRISFTSGTRDVFRTLSNILMKLFVEIINGF